MVKKILRADKKIDEAFLSKWFSKLTWKKQWQITFPDCATKKIAQKTFNELSYTDKLGWYYIYQ